MPSKSGILSPGQYLRHSPKCVKHGVCGSSGIGTKANTSKTIGKDNV